VSRYQKKHSPTHHPHHNRTFSNHYLLDFNGAREDNRGRYTDSPAGRHPLQTNQRATSIIPLIFTPDALPAATLPIHPGLGQAQEYARLHTPWLGWPQTRFILAYYIKKTLLSFHWFHSSSRCKASEKSYLWVDVSKIQVCGDGIVIICVTTSTIVFDCSKARTHKLLVATHSNTSAQTSNIPCETVSQIHSQTREAPRQCIPPQRLSYQYRDPDPYPDPWSGSPPKFNHFFTGHCQPSVKISCKSVSTFLHKLANRQTDRQKTEKQTNKQWRSYISSFTDVTMN